jgi:membrane-associated phospholipid phosphatase
MKPFAYRLLRYLAARLTPGETYGLHMTVGMVLMALAALVFGDIAADVMERDDITALDHTLAHWFHQHKHSAWTPFMLFITHWHQQTGIALMMALFACYLYRRRERYWLVTVLLAVPGGMLLNVLLKYSFQRARPVFEEPLVTLATYSFPSGHASGATLLYGVLAAWFVCTQARWRRKATAVLGALVMVALVALSRVYLGAHYLSDVLAAMVFGCGWLAVCITGMSTLRRSRAAALDAQRTET